MLGVILMILCLLFIHNHDRKSYITRVLRTTTWVYFSYRLPGCFTYSPKAVKEAIMSDIDNLVQEFWRISSDNDVGASFFAMRRLRIILECYLEVCLYYFRFYDCH